MWKTNHFENGLKTIAGNFVKIYAFQIERSKYVENLKILDSLYCSKIGQMSQSFSLSCLLKLIFKY